MTNFDYHTQEELFKNKTVILNNKNKGGICVFTSYVSMLESININDSKFYKKCAEKIYSTKQHRFSHYDTIIAKYFNVLLKKKYNLDYYPLKNTTSLKEIKDKGKFPAVMCFEISKKHIGDIPHMCHAVNYLGHSKGFLKIIDNAYYSNKISITLGNIMNCILSYLGSPTTKEKEQLFNMLDISENDYIMLSSEEREKFLDKIVFNGTFRKSYLKVCEIRYDIFSLFTERLNFTYVIKGVKLGKSKRLNINTDYEFKNVMDKIEDKYIKSLKKEYKSGNRIALLKLFIYLIRLNLNISPRDILLSFTEKQNYALYLTGLFEKGYSKNVGIFYTYRPLHHCMKNYLTKTKYDINDIYYIKKELYDKTDEKLLNKLFDETIGNINIPKG